LKAARFAMLVALAANGCSFAIDFGSLDSDTGAASGASSIGGSAGVGGASGSAGGSVGGASGSGGDTSAGGVSGGASGATSGASGAGTDGGSGGSVGAAGGVAGTSSTGGVAGTSSTGGVAGTSSTGGVGGSSGASGGSSGNGGGAGSGGPIDIAKGQSSPLGLTVDATDVYWVATGLPGIFRASTSGGSPARVDTVDDALDDPFDVAIDGTELFWSEYQPNVIRHRALTGGTASDLATGAGFVAFLAVSAGQIFATDYQTALPTIGSIIVADEASSGANVLYDTEPYASGIAAVGTTLSWGRAAGEIILGKAAGGTEMTALTMQGTVGGVAMDAAEIYFLQDNQRIIRVDRTTLDTSTFYEAASAFGGGDVALDATYVYWTEQANGVVRKLAR
jgi:hypothetical protein